MNSRRTEKAPERRWFYPPRSLNQIMTLVALGGLAMATVAPRGGALPARPWRLNAPTRLWTLPTPAQAQAIDDRFVVVAPEGLDPSFVVPAPRGIDDRMIVTPGRGPVAFEARPVWPDVWTIPAPLPPAR